MKKHKLLLEIVKKEETVDWAISILESINVTKEFWKLSKKLWYDCYLKWYPKEILDYQPTNKRYEIKTVEDIAELGEDQFEMFVEDLRSWCKLQKQVNELKKHVEVKDKKWMVRLDTWLHEAQVKVEINTTNKL